MESKHPSRTRNQELKESEIFTEYNRLVKELNSKVKEVGLGSIGFCKTSICETIGEKYHITGHWVSMIITKKTKQERSKIE